MAYATKTARRFNKPSEIPPLRQDPNAPDEYDQTRCEWVKGLWHAQDELLRQRDRQVEENIRMLLGQHWIVWSDLRQRFVNLSETLSDDERRWRHMPVLNRLFLWYVLYHARMTENPPVITWQPGPDRVDAMLAEVMDPVFKYLWRDAQMLEVLDRMFSWMIPSGRAFLKSRIDPNKGQPIQARGRAPLQLLDGSGSPILGADGQPIQREIDDVPLDEEMNPLGRLTDEQGGHEFTGDPFVFNEGGIAVDVVTCLEARGEWGAHIPWHDKSWHIHKTLVAPLQAWETLGVELEPDVRGTDAEDVGIFHRLVHGAGLFGAADNERHGDPGTEQEYVTLYELWQRPGRTPGTQRAHGSPGGRLCIVTGGGKVIRDGVRTAPFPYTSPLRCFDFVNLPGRPQGTSPQEMLNGPVRTRNRLHGQIVGHATLVGNPVRILDRSTGIEEGQVRNVPGEEVVVDRSKSGNVPVMEYVAAPSLGRDVYEAADRLAQEFDQIGSIAGTEGAAPTEDSSGELVKELRFNADRPIGATMKRAVLELARMGEDWKAMVPTIWDQEKIIGIVGEDGIARTITVWPELFSEGTVNAEPEIESMLPEGRGERQQRMERFFAMGLWGDPTSPKAINTFLDLARFPHMSRATRPGGADMATAQQNVGKLLQGTPAMEIPVFEWYDHLIHQAVLEDYMKSPEYLKLDPLRMEEFALFRMMLIEAGSEAMLRQAARGAEMEAGAAATALAAGEAAGLPAPTPEAGPQKRPAVA